MTFTRKSNRFDGTTINIYLGNKPHKIKLHKENPPLIGGANFNDLTPAHNLQMVYTDELMKPPDWTFRDFYKNAAIYKDLAQDAVCYSFNTDFENVKKVLIERQPVNIDNENNGYSVESMENLFKFGGEKSGYTKLMDSNPTQLPPNIAVYVKTPFVNDSGDSEDKIYNDYDKWTADSPNIHVLNSIGFAFDQKSQPDYKYFFDDAGFKKGKQNELIQKVGELFKMVFVCAGDKQIKKIAFSLVGGGFFARNHPGDSNGYVKDTFKPAIEAVLDEMVNKSDITEIGMIGTGRNDKPTDDAANIIENKLKTLQNKNKESVTFKRLSGLPIILNNNSDTLFQNAWDPHSIAGNGNKGDKSLDGRFGRQTAIGLLSFPATNPDIKVKIINPANYELEDKGKIGGGKEENEEGNGNEENDGPISPNGLEAIVANSEKTPPVVQSNQGTEPASEPNLETLVASLTTQHLEDDNKIDQIEVLLTKNWQNLYKKLEGIVPGNQYTQKDKSELTQFIQEMVAAALLQTI